MKLSEATIDIRCHVTDIINAESQARLLPLGMLVGCEICPLRHSGDTTLVDVRGCRYALNKEVSDSILVEPIIGTVG